jgi:hypothetical protein
MLPRPSTIWLKRRIRLLLRRGKSPLLLPRRRLHARHPLSQGPRPPPGLLLRPRRFQEGPSQRRQRNQKPPLRGPAARLSTVRWVTADPQPIGSAWFRTGVPSLEKGFVAAADAAAPYRANVREVRSRVKRSEPRAGGLRNAANSISAPFASAGRCTIPSPFVVRCCRFPSDLTRSTG